MRFFVVAEVFRDEFGGCGISADMVMMVLSLELFGETRGESRCSWQLATCMPQADPHIVYKRTVVVLLVCCSSGYKTPCVGVIELVLAASGDRTSHEGQDIKRGAIHAKHSEA